MKAADLETLHTLSRPALLHDGRVVVALARPDLESNKYQGGLWVIDPDAPPVEGGSTPAATRLTFGGRDSAPVASPDGRSIVFLRAVDGGKPQLMLMPADGGEPRTLISPPLGAGGVVFSPDGTRIAYVAGVPEQGRYGTDEKIDGDAEAPRPIRAMNYRRDGRGFLADQPLQVFVLGLAEGSEPVQLTGSSVDVGEIAFTADGSALLVTRSEGADTFREDLLRLPLPPADGADGADEKGERALEEGVVKAVEFSGGLSGQRDTDAGLLFVAVPFEGVDYSGRTAGVHLATADGSVRRLTDTETVDIDLESGTPVLRDGRVLAGVLHRGRVELRTFPVDAADLPLEAMHVLLGGELVVRSFTVRGDRLAAVVGVPGDPAEVVVLDLTDGTHRTVSDFGAVLAAGACRQVEITAIAPDGYPVHGFLVLPEGDGPHPVLLDVHGGPHAQYTWGFFDEAQAYAGAGYAVVLPNPRGSAGYGQEHGMAVRYRMGTVDVADVLALLDAALERADLDAERVGVMGGSYGGFMTSWLVAHHPERFVAGISERAVNAWDSFAGSSDIGWFFAENYVGTTRDAQWQASPLAYADKVGVPLLIIHSEQDWRCPVEQAQRLFVALRLRGAETEMLLFPGEGHELSRSGRPQHRAQRFAAILDWWERYLPVRAT
ncbi:alpha/beta fold hydrolase [Nakamurella sp. YIM 132087]|uniref:Alpha/beta fold hydrolase n=1 Tax=Nakamurella alba TaxID=2665158 RepID=A0A7K1FRK6_9ACTN|nr:S9 family peptidase [Nakamurella alba]MTD16777.1 alpha/beta fold hydrolase [Nakamurella alba]